MARHYPLLGEKPDEVALTTPAHPDAGDNVRSLAVSEAAIVSADRRGDWVDIAGILG